jgi:hypothetical protein
MAYDGPLHDPLLDPDYPRITEWVHGPSFPPLGMDPDWPEEWGTDETERDLVGGYFDLEAEEPREMGIAVATFLIPRGASPVNLRDYRSAGLKGWGTGWPACGGAAGNVVRVAANRSGARFGVHRRISVLWDLLIDEMERRGYLCIPDQCGAYNCRPIGGTRKASNHSWALAGDINWRDNPFTTTGRRTMPDWVPHLFNKYGFSWGGHYSGAKKDYMHMEFLGTPAQADQCTHLASRDFGTGSPPPPPPTPGGTVLPILKLAKPTMKGPMVNKVQNVLKAWYKLPASFVDGDYGPATVAQVKRAQKGTPPQPKLVPDGTVGPLTYAKLSIR